jgi:hypothetical protein
MLSCLQLLFDLGLPRTFRFVFAKTQTGAFLLTLCSLIRIVFFAGDLIFAILLSINAEIQHN